MTKQEELEFWQLKAALLQTQQVLFQYQAAEVQHNLSKLTKELANQLSENPKED